MCRQGNMCRKQRSREWRVMARFALTDGGLELRQHPAGTTHLACRGTCTPYPALSTWPTPLSIDISTKQLKRVKAVIYAAFHPCHYYKLTTCQNTRLVVPNTNPLLKYNDRLPPVHCWLVIFKASVPCGQVPHAQTWGRTRGRGVDMCWTNNEALFRVQRFPWWGQKSRVWLTS